MSLNMDDVFAITVDTFDVKEIAANGETIWEKPVDKQISGNGAVAFLGNRNVSLGAAVISGACIQAGTPTPDTPLPIQMDCRLDITGKNLLNLDGLSEYDAVQLLDPIAPFDESWLGKFFYRWSRNGYFRRNALDGVIINHDKIQFQCASQAYGLGFPLRCVPSATYYVSCSSSVGNFRFGTRYYDYNRQPLNDTVITNGKFVAPANAYYMVFCITTLTANDLIVVEHPMLAISADAAFEPYTKLGDVDLSSLQLAGVGASRDTYNAQSGKTQRVMIKKVFDGTENITSVSSTIANYFALSVGAQNSVIDGNIICSHLAQADIRASTSFVGINITNSAGYHDARLVWRMPNQMSVAEMKAWLAAQYANGTPLTVYYAATTPTEEDNAANPITQRKGYTTICNIANAPINITYKGAVN